MERISNFRTELRNDVIELRRKLDPNFLDDPTNVVELQEVVDSPPSKKSKQMDPAEKVAADLSAEKVADEEKMEIAKENADEEKIETAKEEDADDSPDEKRSAEEKTSAEEKDADEIEKTADKTVPEDSPTNTSSAQISPDTSPNPLVIDTEKVHTETVAKSQ